jgi:hypothetical protein
MANSSITYKKLTRYSIRRTAAFEISASRAQLYLGPDHLLLLEKTFCRESYRRFYFRDIQALVLQKTNDWLWYSLICLGGSLLFGAISLAAVNSSARYFFLPLTAACVLGLVINSALGQSCHCHMRTAVQYEILPGLHRVREADKIRQRLRPLLQEAQRFIAPPPAESAGGAEPLAAPPEPVPEADPASAPETNPEPNPESPAPPTA